MIYQFGRIKVKFCGKHQVVKLLDKEYSRLKLAKECLNENLHSANFVLNILNYEDLIIPSVAVKIGSLYVADGKYIVDHRENRTRFGSWSFAYDWKNMPYEHFAMAIKNECFMLTAYCDPLISTQPKFITYLNRLRHWNYITPIEHLAKNLIYNLLEPFLQLYMLNRGQTFIHCAGVYDGDKNKSSILFVGVGGVGKTTLALRFVLFQNKFKLLCDDLCIIDDDGYAYFYPKYLQIYGYNIADLKLLDEILIRRLGLVNRCHWYLFKYLRGNNGVRRRIAPAELVGNQKLAPLKTKIGGIYYIVTRQRVKESEQVEICEVESDKLARFTYSIITAELWSKFKYFNTLESISEPKITFNEIWGERLKLLYTKIFAKINNCRIVYIPATVKPEDLYQALVNDLM